jgi:hypothetical protein
VRRGQRQKADRAEARDDVAAGRRQPAERQRLECPRRDEGGPAQRLRGQIGDRRQAGRIEHHRQPAVAAADEEAGRQAGAHEDRDREQ